ncbi:hypothetical protein SEA_ATUIN_266 [Arthrobacter phage Atuin]|nr:hypothetical protein SEA_ATUIN_65 [Arthrobacter phage Atuin]
MIFTSDNSYRATLYLIGNRVEVLHGLGMADAKALQLQVKNGESVEFDSNNASTGQLRVTTIPAHAVITLEVVEE